MPHSKTPGGAGASDKFLKQQAESGHSHLPPSPPRVQTTNPSLTSYQFKEHGEGASNAAGHTEGKAPGEAPVRLALFQSPHFCLLFLLL